MTYREFTLPGPVSVYVARMDISATDVVLESAIATGSLAQGLETVSEMARRYDQTLSAWGGTWGPRQRVLVAVNGSSYTPESGEPYGGLIHDGWYALRFGDKAGTSGLAWSQDRRAVIGGCVENIEERNVIRHLPSGTSMEIRFINERRGKSGLILFTPQYDGWTPEREDEVEIVIEVERPVGAVAPPRSVSGVVHELRESHGHTPILFDQVVLAADGRDARAFVGKMHVGDQVEISQEITDLGRNCRSSPRLDWSNVYASIGGGFEFLRQGEIYENDDIGYFERDPRTAFCLNHRQVDFVVVDGRQPGYSIGMTQEELGEFCRDELDDTYGINQDGGGSSAMWVNGTIVNRPSDGHERAVANGMMMVVVEPPIRSRRFAPGFDVLVQQPGELRLGPGFNYPVRDPLPAGVRIDILPTLPETQGVFATGMFWWKAMFNENEGWVQEASLVSPLHAWAIFEIPAFPTLSFQ
ncbi:MAG TPA: phosphodiester glycosidase family protein [Anaerolineales bacterium]|nr:phosphodiester glycosidase family protein [Anaerolineales bacterium]